MDLPIIMLEITECILKIIRFTKISYGLPAQPPPISCTPVPIWIRSGLKPCQFTTHKSFDIQLITPRFIIPGDGVRQNWHMNIYLASGAENGMLIFRTAAMSGRE
jgi:hypothetical protein